MVLPRIKKRGMRVVRLVFCYTLVLLCLGVAGSLMVRGYGLKDVTLVLEGMGVTFVAVLLLKIFKL